MTDILILAAGSIKKKLHLSGFIFESPALIPIHTKNVTSLTIDFYLNSKCNIKKVYIAVDVEYVEQLAAELTSYKDILHIIPISNSIGVVDTLAQSIRTFESNDLIINIAPSIPYILPIKNSIQIDNITSVNKHWSTIELGSSTRFHPKNGKKNNKGKAFLGIFRSNKAHIMETLERVTDFNDLIEVAENLYKKNNYSFQASQWIDCGHETNFYSARTQLLSSRTFNRIHVESIKGILSKSSSNIEKLENELNFVNMLPSGISHYFPRTIGALERNNGLGTVKMEYYGYPNLAEYLLYWKLEETTWDKIFNNLKLVLNDFHNFKYSIGYKAFFAFYFDKTKNRVEEFKQSFNKIDPHLFCKTITINNKEYINFDGLEHFIIEKISSLYDEDHFCIMHGDLCFNNILYDLRSNSLRLIDARGSFGGKCIGIYGDFKYDLAKLCHSTMGQYDVLVNNGFKVDQICNKYELRINTRDNHPYIVQLSEQILADFNVKPNDIYFMMGLLFISMCPLHSDSIAKQQAMYLHGIKYLNESLQGAY